MKSKNHTLHSLGFIALAFAGFASTTAHAAIDTWQGSTGSTDWATDANWTYSTGAAIASGDSLVFTSANASPSTTLTNTLATSFNVAAITFNSGAPSYTMTGNAFNLTGGITNNSGSLQTIDNAITLSNAAHTFNAASGNINLGGAFSGLTQSVTFVGPGTTTLSGTNTFNTAGSNFAAFVVGGPITAGASTGGNVAITGATTVVGTGAASTHGGFIDIHGNSALTIQTGGSLSINGVTNAAGNSIIGQNSTGTSSLSVNGGSLTVSGAQGFAIGNNRADATGVLTVSSGTATIAAGSATLQNALNFVALGRDNATGSVNLDGGTLATGRQFVRDGSSGGTAGAGTATFNFNGGTLQALADQTLGNGWFETVNTGNFRVVTTTVKAGGAKIDTNGFNTNINTVLAHDSSLGDTPDGGLTKSGSGTLTLGGANTYTGPTTISAGRLNVVLPGSIDPTSAVSLGAATLGGNGAVGAVTADNTGAIITNGNSNTDTLSLASLAFSAAGTMNLNMVSDTVTPAVAVTNTLDIGPGFTVNVTTAPSWITGQTYNLISYGSLSGTFSNITKGTVLGLGARQIATLGNADGSITLAITGNTPVWSGIQSGAWTTGVISPSKNWKLLNGGGGTDFVSNDQVIFDDSATGTTSVNISTANVQVASAVFSNDSKPYTISSTGGFGIADGTSPASLTKSGSALLTLNTVNSYTGSTTIEDSATLQLGDGTTDGDIAGSSVITNHGTLVYNRAGGSFSYANVISGSGGVFKNGTGTQILSGSNTYFGGTTINAGTLQVGSGGTTGALGTAPIINDAALVFNRTNSVIQGTDFGLIIGAGSVTQAGSGAVTLSLGNSYSGGTNITAGSLIVGATNALGTGSVTLAGGTLSGSAAADITLANALVAQTSTSSVLFTNGKNLSLNGNLTGSGNINRTATGTASTVFLGGDNSGFSGTFTVDANGSAATRFTASTAGSQNAKWVINQSVSGRASLDFAGGTIQFGSLTGTGFLMSTGLSINTLEVGALGLSETFPGVLNQAAGSTLAVTKAGAGTWTLTGANTYTGDTTVNAGVLAVDGDAIANGNKLVVNGGKVDPMGATEVVGTLYFGATQQASGTYSAVAGPGVDFVDTMHFTGTGVVSVTTGPVAGYTSWAAANGATGQTMDQDHDNDGVKNGIEYFMGQTGSTFTANPATVSGTVTWPMGATYTGVYGTDYEVQSSTDLAIWTQVPVGTGDNTVSVTPGTSVVYDAPTGGKSFVRLVVKN